MATKPSPKIELLEQTPYETLAEHADVQKWRNAFGLMQSRMRELEKMVMVLNGATIEGEVFQMREKVHALENKVAALEDRLVNFESDNDALANLEENEDHDTAE